MPFFGDDGFTSEDLGSIFTTGATTLDSLAQTFGFGSYSDNGVDTVVTDTGTYTTPPATDYTWLWWTLGGIVLIILAVILYRKYAK